MNILHYTIEWYKGEIFEGTIVGFFGLMLLSISMLFFTMGKTPNTQSFVIPLVVVSMILIGASATGIMVNRGKMASLDQDMLNKDRDFIHTEKERVEGFQSIYTYTKIGAGVFFIMATAIFFLSNNRHWQAVAVALIILGLSGIVIDYFSKERADAYYHILVEHSENE